MENPAMQKHVGSELPQHILVSDQGGHKPQINLEIFVSKKAKIIFKKYYSNNSVSKWRTINKFVKILYKRLICKVLIDITVK